MEPTNTIEEQILLYPDLSSGERRQVEALAEENPEYRSLLADVKAVTGLIETAGRLDEDPPGDDVLSHYAAARYLQDRPAPGSLETSFTRIDGALQRHPDLRMRFEFFRSRIEELDAGSDAVSQFEQLTGRRLDAIQVSPAAARADRPASSRRIFSRKTFRYSAAACVALIAAYGLLFAVSTSTRSELDRLAALDAASLDVSGYTATMRGEPAAFPAESSDARFLRALGILREARTSVLGLFPDYDENRLREAEELLETVLDDPAAGDFLHLEAHYFLGKIRLGLGNVESARESFRSVVTGQGRMSGEASRILAALES